MPKLSYLVSTYNAGHFLEGHLADLLEKQTDPDFEIVIVNPNSPGTDEIVAQKWAAVDSRIKYVYHEQREWYGASWMRAWRHASGEFVCNSNTDDYHHPRFTEIMHTYMSVATSRMHATKNEVAFGYAGIHVIDEKKQIKGGGYRPAFDFEKMSYECGAGPQVCWRNDERFKSRLDWSLIDLRANTYRSAFDYWLWLYFMSLGYHGVAVPEILTVYTQRPDSIENSNKWQNNWETFAAISEFFPHHFTGHLKHAREFADFKNLPDKQEWIELMQRGKKWKI